MSNLTDALIAAKLVGGSGGSGGGSGLPEIITNGVYYYKLTPNDCASRAFDVEFYRMDGTPLYVYSTLALEVPEPDTEFPNFDILPGEISFNPDLSPITQGEFQYITMKWFATWTGKSGSAREPYWESMSYAFDVVHGDDEELEYDGPALVFIL